MLTERLLGWTRDAVTEDLAAFDDVDVDSVLKCKQLMLNWIKDAMNETNL